MRVLTGVFCMAAVLLSVAPAHGQRTTGEIVGVITDDSGLVLPGVSITLHGSGVPSTGLVSVSADNGAYRFSTLPPGTYDMDAVLPGFSSLKREGISVGVGATVTLNLTMKVGGLEETITVSGASPVVDLATARSALTTQRNG